MSEHTMSSQSLMDSEQDVIRNQGLSLKRPLEEGKWKVTGEEEEEAGNYRKGTLEKENM